MEVLSRWNTLVENFNTSALEFYRLVEAAIRDREVPEAETTEVEFKEGTITSAKRVYLRVKCSWVAFDICAAPYGRAFFFSWWLVRPGPRFAWLWLLGILFAFLIWCYVMLVLFMVAIQTSIQSSITGAQSGGAGCGFFLMMLGSLPAAALAAGWATRRGILFDEEAVLGIPLVGWLYERLFSPQTYYRYDTALMFQESVRRAVNDVIDGLLSSQGLRALTDEQKKPTIRDLAR